MADPAPGQTADEADGSSSPGPQPAPAAVDRSAAFAAGPPPIPRRAIYWLVAAILVLGVGGVVADRVITSVMEKHTPAVSTGPVTSRGSALPSGHTPPPGVSELHAPLSAFLGITSLRKVRAPGFSLVDPATGSTVSLGQLRGHVVVLTFANAACNDICPVLGAELAQAHAMLGATAVPVTFVTVNSDPLDLGSRTAPIYAQPGLASLPNWRFLTGTLSKLNPVWVSYGITITAERSTGVASHNDLMYFINPSGALVWSAAPFADESSTGANSLPAAEVTRFAQGVARYAARLAGSR